MSKMNSLVLSLLVVCLWRDTQGFTSTPFPTRSTTTTFNNGAIIAPIFSEVSGTAVEASADVEASTGGIEEEDASSEPAAAAAEKKPVQKPERHTLFVGNLPFETTNAELVDVFSKHGTVELVSIPINKETGQARGFAFVDMQTADQLTAAIDALNGSEFAGRTMRVNVSLPRDQAKKQVKKVDEGQTKIYVGNLPFDVTREDVTDFYSKYGKVFDCYLPMNPDTGTPRGFAFIKLSEDVAEKAIEETNGVEFMGRELAVSLPLPPGEKIARKNRDPRQKLYVGNLSFYTVVDTLRDLFSEFGEVHDCYMPIDNETGGSRGFGFVTMDKEAADNAIDATDGCELDGRIIRVNAAQPKGQQNRREESSDWNDDSESD